MIRMRCCAHITAPGLSDMAITNACKCSKTIVNGVFYDFSLTVKAAPHEFVSRTGQPST